MTALNAGKIAPLFELTTTTGERLSLDQALARGPVLLAFFKVTCPTCQFTFPFLERIYQQLRETDGQVWGIVQDNAQDGARFARNYGVSFPILIDDAPYKVSRLYNLAHVPTLFLVESDGQIAMSSEGFSKAELLAIQQSLAQLRSAAPAPLFLQKESVPEYKPG
jgi:peroxiredoxin